jgi:hypothetical protein
MEDNRRDEIIDDLLTRRPKGLPTEKVEYEEYSEFCWKACKDKARVRCLHDHWGYDVDTLFNLGFRTQSELSDYIVKRFYGKDSKYNLKKGEKSGASRKINRIWSRIDDAVEQVQAEGRPGIYRISRRWNGNSLATVWAHDHDEAKQMATMFYGHVLPDGDEIRTHFTQIGTHEDVIPVNVEAIASLRHTIEHNRSRIERWRKEIEEHEARIEAIQMMQSHLLANHASRVENS